MSSSTAHGQASRGHQLDITPQAFSSESVSGRGTGVRHLWSKSSRNSSEQASERGGSSPGSTVSETSRQSRLPSSEGQSARQDSSGAPRSETCSSWAEWSGSRPECACGCGQKIANPDARGRPRKFARGHNLRSVWTIAIEPTPFAHFATWPQKLVQRMILAGTSERGVCPECGAPWVRETSSEFVKTRGNSHPGKQDATGYARIAENENPLGYGRYNVTTLGWKSSCKCGGERDGTHALGSRGLLPATILDPFGGSGTTAIVARKLHRKAILIELNESYCALEAERLAQQSLFAEVPF